MSFSNCSLFFEIIFPFFWTTWNSRKFLSKPVGNRKISQFRQKKFFWIIPDGKILTAERRKTLFHYIQKIKQRNVTVDVAREEDWTSSYSYVRHLVHYGSYTTVTNLPFGWERLACLEWPKSCLAVAKYQWTLIRKLL